MKRVLCCCVLLLITLPAFSQTQINVALPANGSVTTASSTYNTGGVSFPATNAVQGDRKDWCGVGQNGCGTPINGWASASLPANIVINFQRSVPLVEIDVFNIQDNFNSPVTPTIGQQCTLYCNTSYEVDYWTGSAWTPIPSGTFSCNPGTNCFVWNQFTGLSITTTQIRVNVTANANNDVARIVGVEAYFSYTAPGSAGTYTTLSCNYGDVLSDILGPTHIVIDGDTVIIASGTCSWTVGITLPNSIGVVIRGTGTPDNSASDFLPSSSCSSGGTTLNVSNSIQVFTSLPVVGNSLTRLSCMTVNATGPAWFAAIEGTCTIAAGCPNFRMDNITFPVGWENRTVCSLTINCVTGVYGVADHNNAVSNHGQLVQFLQVHHGQFPDYFGGGSNFGNWGDVSWANPEYYGTNRFFFMENNTFKGVGCCENEATSHLGGGSGGGRMVIRYNKFLNMLNNPAITYHGLETRQRSARVYEFYGNFYECNEDSMSLCNGGVGGIRGGTGLVWGNSIDIPTGPGSAMQVFWDLDSLRINGTPGNWGTCDGGNGASSYDVNDNTTYFTGIISAIGSISNNQQTLTFTDSMGGDPGWTANQYVGYSVHDTTIANGGSGTEIISNTHNTAVVAAYLVPGQFLPTVNDTFQILRATVCLDQIGRGKGFKYTGSGTTIYGTNSATPLQSAVQDLSPTYGWLNTYTDSLTCITTCGFNNAQATVKVQANRDYYQETQNQAIQSGPLTPFDGSAGMGHGTKANIPKVAGMDHCTAGTGYWATDEGSWNTTLAANTSGRLYLCNPANTWTLSYTPHTYPHDLITSVDNLSFSSQPTNLLTGGTFSPTVTVTANLPGGGTDTSFTGAVTLTINSCGASNSGTTTVNASSGVATFTGVGATSTGNGCTEVGSASGVNATTSNSFNVTGSQSFSAQPTNTVSGNAFSPSIQITLVSTSVDSITLSVTTGTCSLTGPTTVTSTGGSPNRATFSLSASAVGTGCVITSHDRTDGTVADIMSNSFNISSSGGAAVVRGGLIILKGRHGHF